MTKALITETDLHAWLDGESSEVRRGEIESYIASHPHEAERFAAYRLNDEAIREHFDPVLDEPIPTRLSAARAAKPLDSVLEAPVPARPSEVRPAKPLKVLRYAAVVAWLFIGGLAGWLLHDMKTDSYGSEPPVWTRRAAVAHVVYSPEIRHPVEVAADQEAHLVAWLSKRLGTPLKIPRLDALGYGLVGGRLLPGEHGPVAQFMYQDAQGQRLTLYVRTNMEQTKETAFRFAQEGNVRQFYWIDRGLGYVLSGETGKEDLLRVATAVYQHLNP